jgi:hypothetical protein
MSKFIAFTNNKLSARYDSEINTVIPAEAIEVSDEFFFQTINETDGEWTLQPDGTIVKEGLPEPTIESLIEAKLLSLKTSFETAMNTITSQYPASELLSWTKQETEARAWAADNATLTPLVDALATARNVGKADLVGRIIAKADAFAGFSGSLIGKRQKLEDQLAALGSNPSKEQLDEIVW